MYSWHYVQERGDSKSTASRRGIPDLYAITSVALFLRDRLIEEESHRRVQQPSGSACAGGCATLSGYLWFVGLGREFPLATYVDTTIT